jgi:hypothetical protein
VHEIGPPGHTPEAGARPGGTNVALTASDGAQDPAERKQAANKKAAQRGGTAFDGNGKE